MARSRKKGKRTATGQLSRSAEARKEQERISYEEGPMQTVLQARRRLMKRMPPIPDREDRDNMLAMDEWQERAEKWRKSVTRPVSKEEAKRLRLAHRGSVLDRLWVDGKITDQERAAGLDYCQRFIEYAKTNGIPNPNPKGVSLDAIGGKSTRAENIKKAVAAKAQHMTDQRVLRHCTAGVTWAVRRVCVRDEAAPPHLVKEGLGALVAENR